MSVYPFIEAEKVERRNVTKACELMEVSRSAFYDWVQHQPSRREVSDAELGKRIDKIHAKSRGTYALRACTPSCAATVCTRPASGWPGSWPHAVWPAAVHGAGSGPPSPTLTPRPPWI